MISIRGTDKTVLCPSVKTTLEAFLHSRKKLQPISFSVTRYYCNCQFAVSSESFHYLNFAINLEIFCCSSFGKKKNVVSWPELEPTNCSSSPALPYQYVGLDTKHRKQNFGVSITKRFDASKEKLVP